MIYKGLKTVLALLCVGLCIVSCSDDNTNQGDLGASLLPIDDVTVDPLGDEFTVAYTSVKPWTMEIKGDGSWLTVSKFGGESGTTSIQFKVGPNESKFRECSVCFYDISTRELMDAFNIAQDIIVLSVDKKQFNFGWAKSSDNGQCLNVESNIEWALTVSDSQNFILDYEGAEAGGAEGGRSVQVKAARNNFAVAPNQTLVSLKPVKRNNKGNKVALDSSLESRLTQQIKLTQDYLIFLVNDARSAVELEAFSELGFDYVKDGYVSAEDHLTTQTVYVTSEVENWGYDSADIANRLSTWGVELTQKSQNESAALTQQYGRPITVTELEIKVKKPNPGKQSRNCSFDFFVVAGNGERASRPVNLSQKAYVFDNECVGSSEFENLSGEAELQVVTTGPWYIDPATVPSWLKISQYSGVGNAVIAVKAENQNLTFDDYRTTLAVYTGINDLEYTKNFTQKRFVFEISGTDQFDGALPRLDVSDHMIYVTSSGPWTLKVASADLDDGKDWLSVDVFKGDAGERIPVTLKARSSNPDKSNERGKAVSITSNLHEIDGAWPAKAQTQFQFVQDRYRFEIAKNGVAVNKDNFKAYAAETSKLKMTCSAPWKISDIPDWLNFDIKSGDGYSYPEINVTASNNTGSTWTNPRQADIKVSSDVNGDGSYSDTQILTISQDAFVFKVTSSQTTYNVETLNTKTYTLNVDITEGAQWSVTSDSWLGVSGSTTRTGSGTVSFTPQQNGNLFDRKGNLVVKCNVLNHVPQSTYTVSQPKYRFDSTPVTLSTFAEYNPTAQSIVIDCMGSWQAESLPSWVQLSQNTGSGIAAITVTPKLNDTAAERSATFKIVSTVGGVRNEKLISISQRDFVWQLETQSGDIKFDVIPTSSETVRFKSSGEWTASADKSFVTFDKTSGSGNRNLASEVNITLQPNYTFEQRQATVTLRSSVVSSKLLQINIVQPKYEFEVGAIDTAFESNTSTKSLTVKSSGKVNASSSDSWLTCKVISDKITFTASANNTGKERTATVVITTEHYSETNKNFYKEIQFSQKSK